VNSTLKSIVDVFSKLLKRRSDSKPSTSHKKKRSHAEPVAPLSTAARVQKKKAKANARRLKAVEKKEGVEKRAHDSKVVEKKKPSTSAKAKTKKKAKAKAVARKAVVKKKT